MSVKVKYVSLFVLFQCLFICGGCQSYDISKVQPLSPLEECGYVKLTSHSEMMAYLKKIEGLSHKVRIKVIGKSVEGREIPAVMLSEDEVFGSNKRIQEGFARITPVEGGILGGSISNYHIPEQFFFNFFQGKTVDGAE